MDSALSQDRVLECDLVAAQPRTPNLATASSLPCCAHEPKLSACVHALVPSWHDAEDIIQETCLQLWRELEVPWEATFRPGPARSPATGCVHTSRKPAQPVVLSDDLAESVLAEILGPSEREGGVWRCCASSVRSLKRQRSGSFALLRRGHEDQRCCRSVGSFADRDLSSLSRIRGGFFECMQQQLYREERS